MRPITQALALATLAAGVLLVLLWPAQESTAVPALTPGAPARGARQATELPSVEQQRHASTAEDADAPSPVRVAATTQIVAAAEQESGREVHGWVLDPLGRALPGARITPWRRQGNSQVLDKRRSCVTDAAGSFQVLADATGPSELVVEHPDFLLWNDALGEERPVSIQMREPRAMRGRVVTAQGTAAIGAAVHYDTQGLRPARRVVSVDEQGRFAIEGLRPGTLRAFIRGPQGQAGPLEWTVGDDAQELLVRLPAVETIRVLVLDSKGQAMEGARVSMILRGTTRAQESINTNSAGIASFAVAPDASVRFHADHPRGLFEDSPLSSNANEVTLRSRACGTLVLVHDSPLAVQLTLTRGEGPSRVEVVARAQAGRELRLTSLEVGGWTVVSEQLKSAQSVRFEVLDGQEVRGQLETGPLATISGLVPPRLSYLCQAEVREFPSEVVVARMQLRAGSRFTSSVLAPGLYTVQLIAKGGGFWEDPRPIRIDAGQGLTWTPSPSAATVHLQVRSASGLPLVNASAQFKSMLRRGPSAVSFDSERIVRQHATGTFAGANDAGEIRLELWPEEHQIAVVQAPGYDSVEIDIGTGTGTVNVQLFPRR